MPSIVPASPAEHSSTVYIVLEDFGPLGRVYRETDESAADLTSLVDDILSGQYRHIVHIVAFNVAEGWARDATLEVARAVADECRRCGRDLKDGARDLVEAAGLAAGHW